MWNNAANRMFDLSGVLSECCQTRNATHLAIMSGCAGALKIRKGSAITEFPPAEKPRRLQTLLGSSLAGACCRHVEKVIKVISLSRMPIWHEAGAPVCCCMYGVSCQDGM